MLAVDRAVLIYYLEDGKSHSASGFRIDAEYILTADHCAEGADYRVLVAGRNMPAQVYLRTHRRDIDLAILKIDEGEHIDRVSCARICTSHASRLEECCALAFPLWKREGRAQLDGYVPTGEATVLPGLDASAETSKLAFKCVTPPPASASRLAEITGDARKRFSSQWRGASGGAIVHDRHVVGVLSNHVLPEGDASLAFTPMTAIDGLSPDLRDRFLAVLGSRGTAQWVVVPEKSLDGASRTDARTGLPVLVDPAACPDAESESLFQGGLLFAEQKQHDRAADLWRRAAGQGHVGAMNNLAGFLYAQRKLRAAHEWYLEAVERGHVEAMGNLAALLLATRQFGAAEKWCREAAKTGAADSMYNLAILLDMTQRFDEALVWYRRAAEADHRDAMHNLAIRLRSRGVPDEAAVWWRRAGHKRAQTLREKLCKPLPPAKPR